MGKTGLRWVRRSHLQTDVTPCVQPMVKLALLQQLCVRPVFHQASLVQNNKLPRRCAARRGAARRSLDR